MVVYEDTFQLHFEACINNQYIYSKIILYNYVIYKGDPSDIWMFHSLQTTHVAIAHCPLQNIRAILQ